MVERSICKAATWFKLNRMESKYYICIFTDLLQALNNPHVTSKLTEDTITQLNLLGKTLKSLSIHRIEAHKGHEGNSEP